MIGETLIRATDENAGPVTALRIDAPAAPTATATWSPTRSPAWIETTFGLDRDDEGSLVPARKPVTVRGRRPVLAGQTGT